MGTFDEQHAQRSGLGAWSRMRWLFVAGVVIAVIVAIVLVVAYGGSGSTGGGY